MKQHIRLTQDELDNIINDIHNSRDCSVTYSNGIISGCSDKHFPLSIKSNYEHIGEFDYDEILRPVGEGDDEFFIRIKLYPEMIPIATKTKYLVITLNEQRVLTDVSLSSSGLSEDTGHFVIGKHGGEFDNIEDATEEAEKILNSEHPELGVEIKTILSKK